MPSLPTRLALVDLAVSRRRSAWMATVLVLLAVLGLPAPATAGEFPDAWYYSGANRPQALRDLEGTEAPEISTDTWIGDEVSIEDLRGDVVIVDFWATWCGPCMRAIPKNVELVTNYGDQGLHIIGLHDSRRGWNTADQVVRDKGINYPVARDRGGQSVKDYKLSFWPTYVAIDRKGVIRAAGLRPDKVEDVIKVLLAEDAPAGSGGGANTVAAAEFPAEWYVGGTRPRRLVALEGKPAPAVQSAGWLGTQQGVAAASAMPKGRVIVLHFVAPWSTRAKEALPGLMEQAAALAKQGVVVLGVSDHESELAKMDALLAEHAGDGRRAFPIARDVAPEPRARLPIGRTATAYGVRIWPMTVVIDRAGRVRAAGIDPKRVPDVVNRLMAERLDGDAAGAGTGTGTGAGAGAAGAAGETGRGAGAGGRD